MLVAILAAFIIALAIARYCYDNRNFYRLAATLPDAKWDRWIDSSLPLLGYGHRLLGTSGDSFDALQVFARKAIETGGIMKLWMGPFLYAMITDPAAAEIVLTTNQKKNTLYDFANSWTLNGLVIANVNVWKRHRKAYNPAFSSRLADTYLGDINKQFAILVERLKPVVGKGIIDVEDYLNKAALAVLCKTALGVDFDIQTNEHLPFLEAVQDQANLVFSRAFRGWLHPELIFQLSSYGKRERRNLSRMHAFSNKIIKTKREELKKRPKSNHSNEDTSMNQLPYLELLLKLCDEDKFITEKQVRAEVDVAMEAGYASSSIAAGLLLTLLGMHPEVQDKLYHELEQYYGDSARDVEKLDLKHLPYLDCVIKEVFRLHPLTPIIIRCIEQDLKISEKITLPAGCDVMVSMWGLHHDPKVWGPDHETFRPERWEDKEAAAKRHVCSYIPFSYGARNCIAKYQGLMQFKIMAIHLMRQFKVIADPAVPMKFKLDIFMKQRFGVLVAFEKR